MNAAEVREALERYWKPSEYLVMHECPQDAMRQGRKIDTLVVSLWKSRGYELDAVEIKVSVSDWMKEVNTPQKADWWWHHTHRFWVAVPEKIGARVQETLPTGWGLLIVGESGVKAAVKPAKHPATPLPWEAIVGIMRASSGAGANALMRERDAGRVEGEKRARLQHEQVTGESHLRRQLDEVLAKVKAFKESSGIDVVGEWGADGARTLGALVAAVREWERHPEQAAKRLLQTAEGLRGHAAGLTNLAGALLPTGAET